MSSLCLCNGYDRGHVYISSEMEGTEIINRADFLFSENVQDGKQSIFFVSSLLHFSRLGLLTLICLAAKAL